MYYYYLLASISLTPTWGKYLTQMQLTQFVTMLLHSGYMLWRGCEYPRFTTLTYHFYVWSMLLLFAQFYFSKHLAGPKKEKAVKAA
jgi:hypothetical protein